MSVFNWLIFHLVSFKIICFDCSVYNTYSSCVEANACCAFGYSGYGMSCFDFCNTCLTNACSSCRSSDACSTLSGCSWAGSFCYNSSSLCEGSSCSSCSSSAQCLALSQQCFWNGAVCANASTLCKGTSCSSCFNSKACKAFSTNCEWNSNVRNPCINKSCSNGPCRSCYSQSTCSAKSNCIWDGYECDPQTSMCISACAFCSDPEQCRDLSQLCIWSDSQCSTPGNACELGLSSCHSSAACLANGLSYFYQSGTCYNSETQCAGGCSGCYTPSACRSKSSDCYWDDVACYDYHTLCSTDHCSSCLTSAACAAISSECKWGTVIDACYNVTTECDGWTCGGCTTTGACTTLSTECLWRDESSYGNDLCYNATMECRTEGVCSECHGAQPCTETSDIYCYWNESNKLCLNYTSYCPRVGIYSFCSWCTEDWACGLFKEYTQNPCRWSTKTNTCYNTSTEGDGLSCSSCSELAACVEHSDDCEWVDDPQYERACFNKSSSTCNGKACNTCFTSKQCDSIAECVWNGSACYRPQCYGSYCTSCENSISCGELSADCIWDLWCYNKSIPCAVDLYCDSCGKDDCDARGDCSWNEVSQACDMQNYQCTSWNFRFCPLCNTPASCDPAEGGGVCVWNFGEASCEDFGRNNSAQFSIPHWIFYSLLLAIATFVV